MPAAPAATRDAILVVEDDAEISGLIRMYLERAGHRVQAAADGRRAVQLAQAEPPKLVILDLMLPGLDGYQVCQELRRRSAVPIIMLTARAEEDDKLRGLSLGADDYVTKPFSPRELVARVEAVLRRAAQPAWPDGGAGAGGGSGGNGEGAGAARIETGDIALDRETMRAWVRGQEVILTAFEWRLLAVLAQAPGRVFSREELLDRLYPDGEREPVDRTIDVHIRNLRQKIEVDPSQPRLLLTVRGVGYRLLPAGPVADPSSTRGDRDR